MNSLVIYQEVFHRFQQPFHKSMYFCGKPENYAQT